jgi:hypothetical protein
MVDAYVRYWIKGIFTALLIPQKNSYLGEEIGGAASRRNTFEIENI